MDNQKLRPKFHIHADGWINDPNGLVVFNGKYHAFFQYYPDDVKWGPMHWGHVVSEDLFNWQKQPVALTPDTDYDRDGCFSGSAIVWEGKLWLLYTGHTKNGADTCAQRQVQCLASSEDGVHFIKHGVVIGCDRLPEGYSCCDFRDPKIWRHNGSFWCVAAARKIGGRGRVLLFRSENLFDWSFVGDIFGKDCESDMTECPDFRESDGILFVSEQFPPKNDKNKHLNRHTTRWYAGALDYQTGKYTYTATDICDYGFDFYAPQTYAEKPVMLGWLNMWDRTNPSEKHGFAGMLTVPRKFEVKNGQLFQSPVIVVEKISQTSVNGTLTDNIKIGMVKISARNLSALSLKMRKKGEKYAEFALKNGEWKFDRSRAGEEIKGMETDPDSLAGVRRMPFAGLETTEITVVFDEFSVEIFADGKALSSTLFPEPCADGLELEVSADTCEYEKYKV